MYHDTCRDTEPSEVSGEGKDKFLLFTKPQYYPRGGFDDFQGAFDTEDDAKAEAKRRMADYYQIVSVANLIRGDYSVSTHFANDLD